MSSKSPRPSIATSIAGAQCVSRCGGGLVSCRYVYLELPIGGPTVANSFRGLQLGLGITHRVQKEVTVQQKSIEKG